MVLTRAKAMIQEKQSASLAELCLSLGIDANVLEPMMMHWVRKGVVACQSVSCQGCEAKCWAHQMIYQWAESPV